MEFNIVRGRQPVIFSGFLPCLGKKITSPLISSFAMGVGNIAIILIVIISLIMLCRQVSRTDSTKPIPIKVPSTSLEVEAQPITMTTRDFQKSPLQNHRPVTFQETSFIREIPRNTLCTISHQSLADQRPPPPRSITHHAESASRPIRRRTYSIRSVDGVTRSLMEARSDYNRY